MSEMAVEPVVAEANGKSPLPKGWRWLRLADIAEKLPSGPPFDRLSCTPLGKVPVIDQSANGVMGFHDRAAGVWASEDHPVVTFANHTCAVRLHKSPFSTIQNVFPLRGKPGVRTEFLYWLLLKRVPQDFYGGHWPRLVEADLPIPPEPVQCLIATLLSEQFTTVETARAAAEAQLAAADSLPTAFLRSILGDVSAERWPKIKLGDLVGSYRNGFGRRPQGVEKGPIVLRLADVSTGRINLERPRRVSMSRQEVSTYGAVGGDLLFVRVNGSAELVGRCVLVENPQEDLVFNDHLIRVRLKSTALPQFVRVVADLPAVRAQVQELATTTAGQLTVNQEMLAGIELQVPDLETQRKVIDIIARQSHEQKTLRESLQQQLETFRGVPYAILRRAFQGNAS